MTAPIVPPLEIAPPYPLFTSNDGSPLEDGYIYIGTENLDPVNNPIVVYWDNAGTITAQQPIRTINGYPSRSGSPAQIFCSSGYSIQIKDKFGVTIFSNPSSFGNISNLSAYQAAVSAFIVALAGPTGASLIGYLAPYTGAVARTQRDKNADLISGDDFGATGDGTTTDTTAFSRIVSAATRKLKFLASGSYNMGTKVLTVPTFLHSLSIGFSLAGEQNPVLAVGNRDGATNSSDPVILASRLVDDSITGNGHCFSDSSIVSRSGNMAYAAYDARFTVTGTNAYNHFAPFQNGMAYGSSGALGYMYGFVDVPSMSAGAVTYRMGARIEDIVKTGGTLGNNVGIWIDELVNGNVNYAIRQVGATESRFDGRINADGGVKIATSPAAKPIESTGTGMSTLAGPLQAEYFYIGTINASDQGSISFSASAGMKFICKTGSAYDASMLNPGSSLYVWRVPTGTNGFAIIGNVGFNGTAPFAKPTITGSRGGNAALASLLTALASYGLVTDSSTA